ncbi:MULTISPECIES: STM3941 family protein [Flavobacteriaceae]|uniref:STM3941 family protein n=1 Tax=Croceitalea marina TaxID=1775166 RepID=A0ABW5MZT6_9FLAO|tara:strand:+ start:112 stop:642 length:531 start_codon:yes stop_codon:yes gene_type:complete
MKKSKVDVPLSKAKMTLIILGCLLFVALGVFMLFNAEEMQTRKFSPLWIMGFGGIAVLFFGGICISVIKKMFDKKPGLSIAENGIWDNSSGVSVGLIEWADVLGIRKVNSSGTRFLLIDVNNPEEYINNAKGAIKRQAMKANNKKYGTPVSISANGLSIKFTALEELILEAFETHK